MAILIDDEVFFAEFGSLGKRYNFGPSGTLFGLGVSSNNCLDFFADNAPTARVVGVTVLSLSNR